MAVLLMAAGAVMTCVLPVRDWGIQTLAAVEPGASCVEFPGSYRDPHKGSRHDQSVGCGGHHG